MSAVWSLTVGGVSGPGVEPSCLGNESGAEVGGDNADASGVANTVGARSTPTTVAMLADKMLESMKLLNNDQWNIQLLTLHCYQSLNLCRLTIVQALATNEEEKITSI